MHSFHFGSDGGPLVIQRIRQILPSADQSSTAMLNGMDDILRLDDQIMRDLRQEIAYSKVLITLPARQQSAFYRESILPVQDHENILIAEEVKKLKELRSMGVQFPTDVLQKID